MPESDPSLQRIIQNFDRLGLTGEREKSLYLGAIANKRYSSDDFWYRFGYTHVGILFLGFSCWLYQKLKEDGVDHVFFLSRDGHVMKKVFDIVTETLPGNTIPARYMYASRRALNIPAMTDVDQECLDFLVCGANRLTVSQVLERVGLEPLAFEEKIRAAGIPSLHWEVRGGRDYEKLRSFFISIKLELLSKAQEERAPLSSYLESIDFFEGKRTAIVDIGWHGSMQQSIEKLLKLLGKENEVNGYYLGTFPPAKKNVESGLTLNGYLCELGAPGPLHDAIKLCVEIFEFIHTAPHGSVLGFRREGGSVLPVFGDTDCEKEKIRKGLTLQAGAIDFVRDTVGTLVKDQPMVIYPTTALAPLTAVLSRPTRQEAVLLGDLPHTEGFGDVDEQRCLAKPSKNILGLLCHPLAFRKEWNRAFWKMGYLKRLSPF